VEKPRRTMVRRRPCMHERDPMMPTRHTPIVSRRPFIDWSPGSIVSRPGTIVSRLPCGVGEQPSIATENPHGGPRTGSVAIGVASLVWPATRDVSSHLRFDSRPGSIPSDVGTNGGRPGSLAMRETIIATRETIVPERETIVPGRETTLARRVGIDACAHTHVPTGRSFVVTGLGSDVYDQTQRGQGDLFDPTGRGCVGRGSLFDPRRVTIVPTRRLFEPRRVATDPRRPGTLGRPQFFSRRPCSFAASPRLTAPTGQIKEVRGAGNAGVTSPPDLAPRAAWPRRGRCRCTREPGQPGRPRTRSTRDTGC
jgi:hypothetical protein